MTFVLGKTIVNDALKNGLLSKIIPLTSFGGVFIYIFGLIFLSESLRPIPILGLLLVIFGSYILNVDQAREDLFKPFKLLFSNKASLLVILGTMFTALTAVFDKMSLLNTNPVSPLFLILIEQVVMSIFLGSYILRREKVTWFTEVKNNFGILFLNSLVFLVVAYFVFVSYTDGPVALVIGIKRLQILFVLLLGYLFLKDKPAKHLWIAVSVMILGTVLIKIG